MNREEFLHFDWEARRGSETGTRKRERQGRQPLDATLTDERLLPLLSALVRDQKRPAFLRADALLAAAQLIEMGSEASRSQQLERQAKLDQLLREGLLDSAFTVHEAAVLGMGVVGSHASLVTLAELALDSEAGRSSIQEARVSIRTRALAAYGLGLAAHGAQRDEVRSFAVHQLLTILESDDGKHMDLATAGVLALGAASSGERSPAEARTRSDGPEAAPFDALGERLLAWLNDPRARRQIVERVPTALGRLMPLLSKEIQDQALAALEGLIDERSRATTPTRRSAALALGLIGDADDDKRDRKIRKLLSGAQHSRDGMLRRYASLSLARVGSRAGQGDAPLAAAQEVADRLQKQLSTGRSSDGPWNALALGVFDHLLVANGGAARNSEAVLVHGLRQSKAPSSAPAYALGCGLSRAEKSRDTIRERFERLADDQARGQLALAFGLTGDPANLPFLQAASADTHHHPELTVDLALARAMLGDRDLVPELIEGLQECDCWASTQGNARALARVADASAVPVLLELLEDEKRSDRAHSEAVRALGWIASGATTPWSRALLPGLDLVGAPETLTESTGFGALDRL